MSGLPIADSAVLVVHGVGDQVRGETALAMARSLAETIQQSNSSCFVEVQRGREELVNVTDRSGIDPFWIPNVDVVYDEGDTRKVRVYEFYWADTSRYELGWLSHLISLIRLVIGLPRLALVSAEGSWVYRVAILVCWYLLMARTVVVLAVHWLGAGPGRSPAISQSILITDIPLNVFFLFLGIGIMLSKTDLARRGINGLVGMVLVTISFLLLQSIPYAFFPLSVSSSHLCLPNPTLLSCAEWFYAPNTLVGIWSYFEYWVIWLLGGVLLTTWLTVVRRAQRRSALDEVEHYLDCWTRRSFIVLLSLSFSSLIVNSALFLLDVTFLLNGKLPFDALFDNVKDATVAPYAVWVVKGAIWPAVFLSGSLVLSSEFRKAAKPLLELVFDLESYLLRRWHPMTMSSTTPLVQVLTLREQLTGRLDALIRELCARHHGGLVVAAHSLGSVIAFDALCQQTSEVPLAVDLLTMGSPLMKLASSYPSLYGDKKAWAAVRTAVRSWQNFYQAADVVGRALTMSSPEGATFTSNQRIGAGGHLGYYEHVAVANVVVSCGFDER